jgi:hypothetical protein
MQTDEDIGKVAAPVPVILCILREKLDSFMVKYCRALYGNISVCFCRKCDTMLLF